MTALVAEFVIYVRPEPKRRPRFGQGRTYTDARTAQYESLIATHARKAMGAAPATKADVTLWCSFHQTDARAADTDNLVKAVSDAIQGVVFADDRQVVHLEAHRETRADANKVHVRVTEVT